MTTIDGPQCGPGQYGVGMPVTPGPEPSLQFTTVCVDCHNAHAMARFYGGLLGWELAGASPTG